MPKSLASAKGRHQALVAANRLLRKAGYFPKRKPAIAAKPLPSMLGVSGLRPAWHGKA